ncbi:hypothetical protein DYD21_20675 [Rhodohalobacter sp. SW132]|uniref:DUF6266 family protein n=1 Tax=Rhodohalobacter sp. SW132 TaxID=2293433 RepID=UPI000E227E7F|nr:DUF6266 family protein [Rhodohalobacter sp. SW132]REL23931.1 hypothetical protein DYD21_20675 [Rhodohalobacter sp. SW132]
MAKLSSGILGGISGTVGNVVGGRWRGIDYIRSKPASVKNPNTEAQRNQRMRFRLVITLLRKMQPFVVIGFRKGRKNQTEMNYAMSVNVRNAISGTYPDLEIDPQALVVSVGDLQGSSTAGLDLSVAETAIFTWINESGVGNASDNDAAMALLYNVDKDAVIYKLHGASRADENLAVTLPESWSGDSVAGYLTFRSETNRGVSNSQFLGTETAA